MSESWRTDLEERNRAEAERFRDLNQDECMLCDAYGQDKRSLFIDCGYAIEEAIPEIISLRGVDPPPERGRGYYLLICKTCRGKLLGHLRAWADECRAQRGLDKDHDGYVYDPDPERNIPMRVDGATVMMTEPEFHEHREKLIRDGNQ